MVMAVFKFWKEEIMYYVQLQKREYLNELKYWSVDRQEAYFDADSSLKGEISNSN